MLDIRLQEVAGYLEMEMVLISTDDFECEKYFVLLCKITQFYILIIFTAHKNENLHVPVEDATTCTVLQNEDTA